MDALVQRLDCHAAPINFNNAARTRRGSARLASKVGASVAAESIFRESTHLSGQRRACEVIACY